MKKTITPEIEEYYSNIGDGFYQTEYGDIYSCNNAAWWHNSRNKQGLYIGEEWWTGGHNYDFKF